LQFLLVRALARARAGGTAWCLVRGRVVMLKGAGANRVNVFSPELRRCNRDKRERQKGDALVAREFADFSP
jgi:hypothetical protein